MRHNILVCENDIQWAENLKRWLDSEYDVSIAIGLDLCIKMLEVARNKPVKERYSVAIIDLALEEYDGLPGTEGFEVLKIAIEDPFLEPIICTGTGDEWKAFQAIQMGAFHYVKKSEAKDESRSRESLHEAIVSAISCRSAVVALNNAIDELEAIQPSNAKIAALARNVYKYILINRGRGAQ